jgi:pseudouridine-5'-phosphate glycosidase
MKEPMFIVAQDVAAAVAAGAPVVALETTLVTHGLPRPHGLRVAEALEAAVREAGATPATIGILAGAVRVGLSPAELASLAAGDAAKVNPGNLAAVVASGRAGSTTVAATAWAAARAGIRIFATGGIGGVHRSAGGATSVDISADLQELAQTPVIVVCAGAKAVLDLPATLEYLETFGVTVIGFGTDEFPAFYSRSSGLPVDVRCDSAAEVAAIWRTKQALGLPGGLLVTVPVPAADEIPAAEIEPVITQAVAEAEAQGLRSAEVTPFLLTRIAQLSGERSLRANLALLKNNARVAAEIAVEVGREA